LLCQMYLESKIKLQKSLMIFRFGNINYFMKPNTEEDS